MIEIFNYIGNDSKVIDIGANVGDFSKKIGNKLPQCEIILIEPNPNCEKHLKELPYEYHMIGLSNYNGVSDLFVENDNLIGTGASIYKEQTIHYEDGRCHTYKIPIKTLDECNFFDGEIIDLIKIDTQGSEKDIIEGGENTLNRTKFILIELSTIRYNTNAPLIDEVNNKLKENGFIVEDMIYFHKFNDGNIFQIDFIYRNSRLKDNKL